MVDGSYRGHTGATRRRLHSLCYAWRNSGFMGVWDLVYTKLRHETKAHLGLSLPHWTSGVHRALLELRDVPRSSVLISVIVPVHDPPKRILEACLSSVLTQTHQEWELCICDDGSTDPRVHKVLAEYEALDARVKVTRSDRSLGISGASNLAVEQATGVMLAFLDHDDELHPQALAEIAHAIESDPTIDVLYTDEDKLEHRGAHSEPLLKPDWSPDYLRSAMCLVHCLCVRTALFRSLGGFRSEYDGSQDFDLALRAVRDARRIYHIPRILYHWRKTAGSASMGMDAKPYAWDAGRRALEEAALSMVPPATADFGWTPGSYRLRRRTGVLPPVTLAVVSSDAICKVKGRGRIRMLDNFISSILDKTTYPDYEVLVVGEGRVAPTSSALLEACGGRIVRFSHTAHEAPNLSQMVNFAVGNVETEHFVLLHDDLEVISPDWIEALMDYAVDPGVAAVGARLLSANECVQHAGIVCTPAGPDFVFRGMPRDIIIYPGFTHVVRNCAAVSSAVLASTRNVFREAGPFDEALGHGFGDVDFCLRAWDRGYRVIYTPFCELYHFEDPSAHGGEPGSGESDLLMSRWRTWMDSDPYYRQK